MGTKAFKIGFTGDTHGKDIYKIQEVMEADIVIVLGDFGFTGKNLMKLNQLLESHNKTLLFVDGNHEHYKKLNSCKKVSIYGSEARQYAKNIYNLQRGCVYTIAGKSFLVFGGAYSVDQAYRTININWFECEQYNELEKKRLEENIYQHNYKFDYILTHDCPETICKILHPHETFFENKTSTLLDNIARVIDCDKWFFGHHHTDRKMGKFICLWEKTYTLKYDKGEW